MKILIKYCDYDRIDDINYILEHDPIDEEKINLKTIEDYPRIRDFISQIEYNKLVSKEIDYIVFKLEE